MRIMFVGYRYVVYHSIEGVLSTYITEYRISNALYKPKYRLIVSDYFVSFEVVLVPIIRKWQTNCNKINQYNRIRSGIPVGRT